MIVTISKSMMTEYPLLVKGFLHSIKNSMSNEISQVYSSKYITKVAKLLSIKVSTKFITEEMKRSVKLTETKDDYEISIRSSVQLSPVYTVGQFIKILEYGFRTIRPTYAIRSIMTKYQDNIEEYWRDYLLACIGRVKEDIDQINKEIDSNERRIIRLSNSRKAKSYIERSSS